MSSDAEGSAAQREWETISREMRAEVRKLIPLVPAMNPAELKQFVDTLDTLQWMEFKVLTMDKKVELEMAKLPGVSE